MRNLLAIVLLLNCFSFVAFAAAKTAKVKAKDLQTLTGAQWTGTLTYLDYGTNKKVSIPSNLIVTQTNPFVWTFDYQYPDEPKANSKSNVRLAADGATFDGEKVVERTALADKTLRIVTEKSGQDNDKNATFRFTYLIGKTSFSIKKEVKYENANDYFERNEYAWKR